MNEAIANYIPCNTTKCNCHANEMAADLKPFSDGISKEMINGIRDRGTKFQIIQHKIYRDRICLFPARCAGVEYFLKANAKQLPDMEFIVNCRDWPQIHNNWSAHGPVFSFSKTNDYLDIMYPAWSFWEGGPAISLYPTGIGRWDRHREIISRTAEQTYPWDKKLSIGFFRGSRTSSERDALILLSRSEPNVVDAKYTKNQAWKSAKDTLNAEPAAEVSFEAHCQYKFLFNFRGVAASFRFKHLFLCKSLVFHVGTEWKEFFYESMKPWIHYVPVSATATIDELRELLEFFQTHDELAKKIADQGYEHIWNNLRMNDIHCYWRKLLKRYAKRLKYTTTLDPDLIAV